MGVNHSKISAIADRQSYCCLGVWGVNHSKISAIADVIIVPSFSTTGVNHSKISAIVDEKFTEWDIIGLFKYVISTIVDPLMWTALLLHGEMGACVFLV